MHTKSKLEGFRKQRKSAREVSMFRLYEDVHDIKKLDKHILEFLELVRKDVKNADSKSIDVHARAFEDEVHAELQRLMDLTRQDFLLYIKVLKTLATYKEEMDALNGRAPSSAVEAEIKYAELITKNAYQQLESLNNIFVRMRRS